ncbi:Asp23/Gls24 family envelope stress response protein [Megasphaera vaginalis (ex Srinivasan et al. 2021)]|uniref:Alkaline shock protein Asp23 family protein n=1 Tax=Megasphaera vaginalis (ex Srinivasan et al. 2021) TaxID=1111454 RepID=U7UTI7_9FIRM|nr:Asp23/Gls24 family envelope stress response protein [Megasphaera vaginalis (ex Srinivasan et al. 2021)]ERT61773.1 alkaline shock protein Asp23 family protein [Megasphaera vaginalis (ex Srinivasan et al. 2021)]
MKIIGFIGPSGTGKSHHALVVAYDNHIDSIIDDGLLIYQNRIIAGCSAKDETNRMRAVRCAIFLEPSHAAAVREALSRVKPEKLLILGTSKHMVQRIREALYLPPVDAYIRIEEVSCAAEIAKARAIRKAEGKHIIPVPTMELKSHFHGYLLDPIRSFLHNRSGKKGPDFEQSVVRPIFSYYGKLIFSDDVFFALIRHCLAGIDGIVKVNRVKVAKNYVPGSNGLAVVLGVTVRYGVHIKTLMQRIRCSLQDDIEYTTGMSVDILKITVRDVVE